MEENKNERNWRYLEDLDCRGQLSGASQAGDAPVWGEGIDLSGEMAEALRDDDVMSLRRQISEVLDRRAADGSGIWDPSWRRVAMVAGMAFLLIFGTMVYMVRPPMEGSDLFSRYYTSYPALASVRSGGEDPTPLHRAFSYYEAGKWDAASKHFSLAVGENASNQVGWFYLGLTRLEMDRPLQALGCFNWVASSNDPLLRDQASWYSALALIKAGHRDRAKDRLDWMIEKRMWPTARARGLIKQID